LVKVSRLGSAAERALAMGVSGGMGVVSGGGKARQEGSAAACKMETARG
jgi:hypothetical protein